MGRTGLAILLAMAMTMTVSGCGGKTEPATPAETTAEEAVVETVKETAAAEMEIEAVATEPVEAETIAHEIPEDGIYEVEFKSDSSMFHVNEACEGKGRLTVENGQMMLHISLASKKIVNLYVGMADDAKEDEANWLMPTTDVVTYSDGMTEEVYGFDVPVPGVGEEFQLALIGTHGNWYDHKVSIKNPVPAE